MADETPEVDRVLEAVGPRLRSLREERGATLAQLSRATGISVSTLSRLESGLRRPTLELLLLLAQAHQVPLDELVDAPETGDPRIRLKPVIRNGMTMLALTRRPGGLQAYKIVIPPYWPPGDPDLEAHEGPLSGRRSAVDKPHKHQGGFFGRGFAADRRMSIRTYSSPSH